MKRLGLFTVFVSPYFFAMDCVYHSFKESITTASSAVQLKTMFATLQNDALQQESVIALYTYGDSVAKTHYTYSSFLQKIIATPESIVALNSIPRGFNSILVFKYEENKITLVSKIYDTGTDFKDIAWSSIYNSIACMNHFYIDIIENKKWTYQPPESYINYVSKKQINHITKPKSICWTTVSDEPVLITSTTKTNVKKETAQFLIYYIQKNEYKKIDNLTSLYPDCMDSNSKEEIAFISKNKKRSIGILKQKKINILKHHTYPVSAIAWSLYNHYLASGDIKGNVFVVDSKNNTVYPKITCTFPISSLAWNTHGNTLIIGMDTHENKGNNLISMDITSLITSKKEIKKVRTIKLRHSQSFYNLEKIIDN